MQPSRRPMSAHVTAVRGGSNTCDCSIRRPASKNGRCVRVEQCWAQKVKKHKKRTSQAIGVGQSAIVRPAYLESIVDPAIHQVHGKFVTADGTCRPAAAQER